MSSFPENTTVALIFQGRYTLQPLMSYWGFMAVIRVLTGNNVGVTPFIAETQTEGYQAAARHFLDKMTAQYLIILDIDVTPPDFGLEYLVKAFEGWEKCGVMAALTFWQPAATPNLFQDAGKEHVDDYTFHRYTPMMNVVGRHVVKYQEETQRGEPLLMPQRDSIVNVDVFNGGMFVTSREVLEKMGQLIFHDRKGASIGTFTNKVRTLGYGVKAALHIICSGGGMNHIDFLSYYGKPKD